MDVTQERDFEDFVRHRSSALLRTAYLLTGDQGHAEDLLQVVLMNVARRWGRIQGPKEHYVRRALTNTAVNGWRRRRAPEAPLSLVAELPVPDAAAGLGLRDELLRALFHLSAKQRAVLVLRYFEDMSEADIAATLDCSRGAVKSHASRGLARLRQITDEHPDGARDRVPATVRSR